ncbi:MAG: nucleotidyltransferase domain-containing protein [Candidatus Cloacimonetes bacterium]|nr:nucleotidyltransferase domain-containing protein [Candidatus Cloacimonadota bacterium]
MGKKEDAIEIAKKYAEVLKKRFQIELMYIFGSYITGNYREESDIDIAVIIKEKDYDFLLYSKELFRLRREVDLRIEPVLLDSIHDLVFLKEIAKSGIQII